MQHNLCACMGPMYNEPHCPCEMKRLGIERSKEYKASITPEAIAARNRELDAIFSKVFEWRKNGRN